MKSTVYHQANLFISAYVIWLLCGLIFYFSGFSYSNVVSLLTVTLCFTISMSILCSLTGYILAKL